MKKSRSGMFEQITAPTAGIKESWGDIIEFETISPVIVWVNGSIFTYSFVLLLILYVSILHLINFPFKGKLSKLDYRLFLSSYTLILDDLSNIIISSVLKIDIEFLITRSEI